MTKVSLRFLRAGLDSDNDDVINVYATASGELFRVVYEPSEISRKFSTYMSRNTVVTYIMDILKAMPHDVDPFDRIQVTTDLHPSILYAVPDMEVPSVRRNIENLVYTSLRAHVVRA